ncbi:MAG TPA: fibronectin type III domain-containing protein [Tepidisphaeraceae bacterium]|jgi:fibronectin type 3 domain-containing protein|nr:fibronectin type III domain-containing protein [Tepidisphaeraceae bacterium]
MIESLENRRLLAGFTALIDFQPPNVPTQSGYKADTGAVFGDRGNGLSYGWNAANNNGIDRNSKKSPNQAYDTFNQMQKNGNFTWEIAVPNGTYDVRPVAGDATSVDAFYHILAEGQNIIFGRPSSPYQLWIGGNKPINVTDGRLTISNGASAVNNKIAFIEIRKAAPTIPSNLTATATSSSTIQLNWKDNAINEDNFVVERAVGSSYSFQAIATLGPNSTSFLDSGLAPDTRYTYQIRATNDVGSSQPSYVASATTPSIPGLAPAAPTNLTFSVSGNVATLTWTDNSDNEDKFVIQTIGYSGGFETLKEIPANSTSTTVWLHSATINSYRVVARNSAGGNSDPSNVVQIATKPEPPIYPGAQAVSSTAIDLFWDSLDSCQFHVEKLIDGVWTRIATDLANLTYRDAGLTPGTTYSYRIIAVAANEAGDSEPSDVVTATTAPPAVTGLHVTATTASTVTLAWNDLASENGYYVERSLDGINWTGTLLYANTTSYTVTGLTSGQNWLFRVSGFVYGPVLGDRGDVVSATPH